MPTRRAFTDQELLEHLRTVAARLGRPPTMEELDAMSVADTTGKVPSASTIKLRFGRYSTAMAKALGKDVKLKRGARPASARKLELDVLRLTKHYGRPPSASEMEKDPDAYHPNTYIRRYGSWNKALETILSKYGIPPYHRKRPPRRVAA